MSRSCPSRRADARPSLLPAPLLAVVALVAWCVVGASLPARAWMGPDKLPVAVYMLRQDSRWPAVATVVAVDSNYRPVGLGQGVAFARRGDACFLLTATGAVGRTHHVAARFADGSSTETSAVVQWEPAPGLAVLEVPECPATLEVAEEATDAGTLPAGLVVVSAPTWGVAARRMPVTVEPGDGEAPEKGNAPVARVRRAPSAFVLAGAPVIDAAGRVVGILGRPVKDEEDAFRFLPLPGRDVLEKDPGKRQKLILRSRFESKFHPVRGKKDHLAWGMAHYWIGNRYETIRAFRVLADQDDPDPRYLLALGDMATLVRGQRSDAADLAVMAYRKAADRLPRDPWVLGRLGAALLEVADTDAAERVLRQALRLDQENPMLLVNLGVALLVQGRFSEASRLLRRAVQLKSDSPSAHIDLALALFEEGLFDQALDRIDSALELAPDESSALAIKGMILVQLDRWHEAREILEKAEKEAPFSEMVNMNLAVAQLLSGEVEEGKKTLRFLFRLVSPVLAPRLRLVQDLLDRGRTARAIRLLHRLSRPGPLDLDTWRALAEAAESVKRWRLASDAWREVVHRQPDDMKAKAHLGVALLFSKRHDEAADVLAECVERAPDSPRLLGYLALARIGQGRDDDARELVERLERLDPALAGQVRAAWEKKREASGEDDARSSK